MGEFFKGKKVLYVLVSILLVSVIGLSIGLVNSQKENKEQLNHLSLLEEEKNAAVNEVSILTANNNGLMLDKSQLEIQMQDDEKKFQSDLDLMMADVEKYDKDLVVLSERVQALEYEKNSLIKGTVNGVEVLVKAVECDWDNVTSKLNYGHIWMVNENANSIFVGITTYQQIDLLEVDKESLNMINSVSIEGSQVNGITRIKTIDELIYIFLKDEVQVFDLALEKVDSIGLPDEILSLYSSNKTKAVDGRENIVMYDLTEDLKSFVYTDEEGLKLYDRATANVRLLVENFDEHYIEVDGTEYVVPNGDVHLHPTVKGNQVLTRFYSGYAGFSGFYIYDLDTGNGERVEIAGIDYGYMHSMGDYFSITSNEHIDVDGVVDYTVATASYVTGVYDMVHGTVDGHPIGFSWSDVDSTFYDGVNVACYAVYESDQGTSLRNQGRSIYYYDYKTDNYLDKQLMTGQSEAYVVGVLEDNSAIVLLLGCEDGISRVVRW